MTTDHGHCARFCPRLLGGWARFDCEEGGGHRHAIDIGKFGVDLLGIEQGGGVDQVQLIVAACADEEGVVIRGEDVGGLSDRERTVFRMHFVQEMEIEEIASATGVAIPTVKTHLRRGIHRIRKKR